MFDSLRRFFRGGAPSQSEPVQQEPERRFVDVGWILDTDKARFIWADPRRVKRGDPPPKHAKSVNYCPAVLDHEARLYEVTCPIDLRLRFARNDKGQPVLVNADGENSAIRNKHLNSMLALVSEKEWRHPGRPVLQLITPYIFISDEPVYMTQLPPFMHYQPMPWPGTIIGGRLPIHVWPRPMMWAFEWYEPQKELVLKRGEPWFYLRFETRDPTRPVRVFEAERTPALDDQIKGASAVSNYVDQTFSLFKVAEQRRPPKLLVRKLRGDSGSVEEGKECPFQEG
ncbi:hypothetical protein LWE61_18410 [Sphingobium sufflavum]|uniref:hypothetical protein n=1 Tax=Sphingobium sufflavum TaxID=1129547 RepID=UPI001F48D762|nr:hypothetical protein [Sphingobium sufflavum]MCE7798508.1 hypothetical protein [Sphingobium sufflavum]